MTDHCHFSVHYEGPSTEDHKIDAGDLATSLAGFNDALSTVARYTYGEDVSCRLLVDASIREGSTIADFLFVVGVTGECVIFRVQGKFIGGAEQFAPLLF